MWAEAQQTQKYVKEVGLLTSMLRRRLAVLAGVALGWEQGAGVAAHPESGTVQGARYAFCSSFVEDTD